MILKQFEELKLFLETPRNVVIVGHMVNLSSHLFHAIIASYDCNFIF